MKGRRPWRPHPKADSLILDVDGHVVCKVSLPTGQPAKPIRDMVVRAVNLYERVQGTREERPSVILADDKPRKVNVDCRKSRTRHSRQVRRLPRFVPDRFASSKGLWTKGDAK